MNDYKNFSTKDLKNRAELARQLGMNDPKCFAMAMEEVKKINAVLASRAA